MKHSTRLSNATLSFTVLFSLFKAGVQDFYIKMNICYIQTLTKRVHKMLIEPGKFPHTRSKSGVCGDVPALAHTDWFARAEW